MSPKLVPRGARIPSVRSIALVLAAALGLAGHGAPAAAATAFAAATVDWSTFHVLAPDGSTIAFDPARRGTLLDQSDAQAGPVTNSDVSLIWDEGSYASADDARGDNHSNAIALTPAAGNDTWLHKHLYAESSVTMPGVGSGTASANVLRQGRFTVTGTGRVGFEVNYDLFVSALGNNALDSAHGETSVIMTLLNITHPGSASASKSIATLFDGENFIDGDRGRVNTLRAGMLFQDGDVGLFKITLASSAAASVVPLPGGALLILAPLAVIVRRRA